MDQVMVSGATMLWEGVDTIYDQCWLRAGAIMRKGRRSCDCDGAAAATELLLIVGEQGNAAVTNGIQEVDD